MSETGTDIRDNLLKVSERIQMAAERAGRDPKSIKLVAVTKNVTVDRIEEAIMQGVMNIGENRVQELLMKHDAVDSNCSWHMIGHLQRNKVRQIIDKVALIHSLDSMELAEEINKRASAANLTVDVLIQVNVAGEESKFGISPAEAPRFARSVSKYPGIRVRGLMTIAPYAENPEEIRWIFRDLKRLAIDMKGENIDNIYMDFLSMGMSNDFEAAIEEGANIVRIGSAIFGKRI